MADYQLYARDPVARTSIYMKEHPHTRIRTYLIFEGDGTIRVRKTQRVDATLDLNKAQANGFTGYRGKEMVCTSRIPLVEFNKLKVACGEDGSGEYDRKKMNRILNDSDYSSFKTVPGRI